MQDAGVSIAQFLDAAAARQPAPGGGAVAALAGALAASMGEMVVNYSLGKKGLEAHADQLKDLLGEFHRARLMLTELMREDQLAFEQMSAAKKLAKDSPQRAAAIAAAAQVSADVPAEVAAAAAAILDLCGRLMPIANSYLLSDLAVCTDLSMATVRCAIHNVRANLPDLGSDAARQKTVLLCDAVLSRALRTVRIVSPKIAERQKELA